MSELVRSLTPSPFWDVERETIDDEKHRRFVIGRVLERGGMSDWRRVRAHYGLPVVVSEAQQMRSLDPRATEPLPRRLQSVEWETVTQTIENAVRCVS